MTLFKALLARVLRPPSGQEPHPFQKSDQMAMAAIESLPMLLSARLVIRVAEET
jgi:hypothetical protein